MALKTSKKVVVGVLYCGIAIATITVVGATRSKVPLANLLAALLWR